MTDAERLKNIGQARSALQSEHVKATKELREACLSAHESGMQKTKICELAGISRPTLDEWITKA